MIRACVFDLDGTLANTLESMSSVANRILAELGLETLPADNFRYYSGEGADMLVRRCLIDAGDKDLTHYEEMRKIYRERFDEDPLYKVVPYPGIPEMLREMKKRGIYTAVCSNKPHEAAVKVIASLFGDSFDLVIGQSDRIRRKPAPDAPLKAAETFGVRPGECMYAGDTRTDMLTGKAAGMYTVGVLWGFRDREELESSGADTVVNSPEELLELSIRD
ncbi:MAG TPA: HAD family hydrolase [Candidatus Blautia excrementigallinarum]|nr:HAD family hydrolase [Candidatus Blautia excrementigallinarum]